MQKINKRFNVIGAALLALSMLAANLATSLRPASAQSPAPGSRIVYLPMTSTAEGDTESILATDQLMSGMASMEQSRGVTFKTLTRALIVSGIAKDLLLAKVFTLFAPSDAAFAKLPPGTVDTLLRRENRDKLKSLLRYHTLGARVKAADAIALSGKTARTLNGEDIAIRYDGENLFINESKVIAADVPFLNRGVIHVIDAVLIPPSFNPVPAKDIVDTAVAAGNFKTLVAAVQVAGLVDALKAPGSLTVFAPTDAAFAKLPADLIAALLKPENKAKLTEILTYHVLAGKVLSADALKLDGAEVATLGGAKIKISVRSGMLFINESKVIAADVLASNGVIHAIDAVLIPPGFVPPSTAKDIVDTAVAAGNFKTLVAAVQAAGLVDALKAPGPLTVFAPTDAAFAKLPADLIAALLKPENKAKLTEILTYHVLAGKVLSADALKLDGAEVATLGGAKIKISVRSGMLFINESKVIAADVLASNGVIHAIDAVLIPPGFVPPSTAKDIVDTAVAAGNFKTLVAAVQAAGLVDALKAPSPLTVFAPTDAAFAKLPAGLVSYLLKPENKETLKKVLLYHVVDGAVSSAQAAHLSSAKTLQGDRVHLSFNGIDLFVNGARVVAADVQASNGVIHAIDTVLIPDLTIAQVLEASGNYGTFIAAMKAAGYYWQLQAPLGWQTVFAPTDAAFAKLPAGTVDSLLLPANRGQLQSLLRYHLGIGRATAYELNYYTRIHSQLGGAINTRIVDGVLEINGSVKAVNTDVHAVNGILHGIDTVLTPQH